MKNRVLLVDINQGVNKYRVTAGRPQENIIYDGVITLNFIGSKNMEKNVRQ